jgi:hypothetical protein
MTRRPLAGLVGLALFASAAGAAPVPDKAPVKPRFSAAEALKAASDQLATFKGPSATPLAIEEPALKRALPGCHFFSVRYRQWPVAIAPAKGLRSSNLFAVTPDGKVTVCSEGKDLEKFFKASLPPATTEAQIKDSARAYLRLAEELHQDGFYKFTRMDEATVVAPGWAGQIGKARAVVMMGGNGTLDIAITFNMNGTVRSVTEKAEIRRGVRPRCQATKLLDADPIVRQIAEQDLLIMGRAARPYLDEQRAKAAPELQRAIDRLWLRILEREP